MNKGFKKRGHDDVDENQSEKNGQIGFPMGFTEPPPSRAKTPRISFGEWKGAHGFTDLLGYAHHSLCFGVDPDDQLGLFVFLPDGG